MLINLSNNPQNHILLRRYPVQEAGDDGEDYVREPEGKSR